MAKYLSTIGLLFLSNAFMTMAWYGHLKFFGKNGHQAALWTIVLISWGLAFFEYCFQVPANRIGFAENGGPFSLVQLKVIQEAITLIVFMVFSLIFFRDIHFTINHVIGFLFFGCGGVFYFQKIKPGFQCTNICG